MNPFLGRFSDSIIYSKRCLGIKWGSSACIGEFIASSNIGEYDYSMFKILNHENMHITFSCSRVPLKHPPLQFNCLCVYLTATKSDQPK